MSEPSMSNAAEKDAPTNIVQRIVNAWDCCGTCAGGVLAQYTREAKAGAWDEAVKSAHLHETEHWLGIKHDPNPYRDTPPGSSDGL